MTSDNESDDSGSEYTPSVILEMTPAPLRNLRYAPACRAAISARDVAQIRNMHSSSLNDVRGKLWDTVRHLRYRGASPADLTPAQTAHATAAQAPLESAFREVFDDHELLPVADRTPTPAGAYDDLFASFSQVCSAQLAQDFNGVALPSEREQTPTAVIGAYVYGQGSAPVPVQDDTDFEAFFADQLASESWIDPYGLPENAFTRQPVCNVPRDSEEYHVALYMLANSGVNASTDYPVSNSPRMRPGQIRNTLRQWYPWYQDEIYVGQEMEPPEELHPIMARNALFVLFSYTNLWQPRTEIARATEGEPLSPTAMSPRGFI
jgi:hypothetical protein